MGSLKTALLFQSGNFVGREYFAHLIAAGRKPELVIAAGKMSEESIAREIDRTGGLWSPPEIPSDIAVHKFEKLNDPALWKLIRDAGIDVAIQGGVGILKPEMIATPKFGIVNVHPGKLPQYRGNSCPEWALFNGDEVWATAHMIDQGIDTGPVILEKSYDYSSARNYFEFRARLYAHCAQTLVAALERLETAIEARRFTEALTKQDERHAHYWQPMTAAETAQIRAWVR